jgi:hypothetical protein
MKLILAAALITAALPGVAQAKDAKPAKEKKVCRDEDKTGSRFKVTTCHTEAEWVQIDAANKGAAAAAMDANRQVSH